MEKGVLREEECPEFLEFNAKSGPGESRSGQK